MSTSKSIQTKLFIIETAIHLIAKEGFHQLTFDGLAKNCGLTRQLIHKYFVSKEKIFFECFERVRLQFQEQTSAKILKYVDPTARLKAYSDFTFEWIGENREYANIFLLYFHLSVFNAKMRDLNTEFVEAGTSRIIGMLQAIDSSKDSEEYKETAKAVQNLITGSLITVMTEKVNQKKIKDICWRGITKLLSCFAFLIFTSFFQQICLADHIPFSFDWGACAHAYNPTTIHFEQTHEYHPFSFLHGSKSGLTFKKSEFFPLFTSPLGFFVSVKRVYEDEQFLVAIDSVELRQGYFKQNFGKKILENKINLFLANVLPRYKRRKWSEQTIAKFASTALTYAHRTYFIEVISKETQKNVGTIAFVMAPFGQSTQTSIEGDDAYENRDSQLHGSSLLKNLLYPGDSSFLDLPLEATGIEIRRRAVLIEQYPILQSGKQYLMGQGEGLAIEPRFFTIDPKASDTAYARIFRILFSIIHDPFFTPYFNTEARFFYTYNDLPRLYTRLGFKETESSALIEGELFYGLEASAKDLLTIIEKFQ